MNDAATICAGKVVAVHATSRHTFSKAARTGITLLAGLGVEGDAHCGALVRHRYLRKRDPTQPNLTQVHLIEAERLDQLRALGFAVEPGLIGENITTTGLVLRAMPLGTRLLLGSSAVVELTGLRTPCSQMDRFQDGLMAACIARVAGKTMRDAGVMAIVIQGGVVSPADSVRVVLPSGQPQELGPV